MTTIDIEQAQTDLNHLIDLALQGESFVILRQGKLPVRLQATEVPVPTPAATRRLGFLEGMYAVPKDIKGPFREEIEAMFGLED